MQKLAAKSTEQAISLGVLGGASLDDKKSFKPFIKTRRRFNDDA